MPSGHKAFLVNNAKDVELLLMHNRTYAAEYVYDPESPSETRGAGRKIKNWRDELLALTFPTRIAHNVSSRKRVDIIARAKQLGVKVTNPKAKVTTEV